MATLTETIDLDAPVATAWTVWADVRRWPSILRHVARVEVRDESHFLWWLDVPGADTAFEAELTEVVPGKRIAWRTTQGAQHSGVVDLHHVSARRSNLTLQIDYEPEGFVQTLGALAHLDAVLTNYDLGQMKAEIESAAAAALPTR